MFPRGNILGQKSSILRRLFKSLYKESLYIKVSVMKGERRMNLKDKEKCIKDKTHNTKVFTSCFPSKKFCYYCMIELREGGQNEI